MNYTLKYTGSRIACWHLVGLFPIRVPFHDWQVLSKNVCWHIPLINKLFYATLSVTDSWYTAVWCSLSHCIAPHIAVPVFDIECLDSPVWIHTSSDFYPHHQCDSTIVNQPITCLRNKTSKLWFYECGVCQSSIITFHNIAQRQQIT